MGVKNIGSDSWMVIDGKEANREKLTVRWEEAEFFGDIFGERCVRGVTDKKICQGSLAVVTGRRRMGKG